MKSLGQTAGSGLARIRQPEPETPLAKLLEWQSMAAGAYSKNTFRGAKAVMRAGRWKLTRMPMRYGEEAPEARGGMARAAEAQGRDDVGQMYK
jgi:hypothetical protein